jgi:hypothetical protein
VTSLEVAFKIVLTISYIALLVLALRWTWALHLDPRATIWRYVEKVVGPPDWVVTRDSNKLYQGSTAIADVTGPVEHKGNRVRFVQLANASGFDRSQPFEYQRLRLRVVQVGKIIGQQVVVSAAGSKTMMNVLEDVQCDIVHE